MFSMRTGKWLGDGCLHAELQLAGNRIQGLPHGWFSQRLGNPCPALFRCAFSVAPVFIGWPIMRWLTENDMIQPCALECWWRLIRLTRRYHVTMSESTSAWPELPVGQWVDTRDTLQLMTQVVGKVRLANTPLMNHWWNVVLYVSARGLTTGLIPYADKGFSIDFDFIDHQLIVSTTGGDRRTMALRTGPIADFYREVMGVLDDLGLSTEIWPMPVEIAGRFPSTPINNTSPTTATRCTGSGWRWCR